MAARGLMLLAAVAAIALAGVTAGASPAQADICVKNPTPDLKPYCPVSETAGPVMQIVDNLAGDDLERPECDLDDPRAPRCAPGDVAPYLFEAVNPANTAQISNLCQVKLEGVTPNEAYNVGQVRFRTRVDCDHHLRSVTIESKLVNALQVPVAYGNTVSCHACGAGALDSVGGFGNSGNNEYFLVATVRFVLEEGQPPGDPWLTTPGAPPDDTSNGNCVAGGTTTKCKLVLSVKSTTA